MTYEAWIFAKWTQMRIRYEYSPIRVGFVLARLIQIRLEFTS